MYRLKCLALLNVGFFMLAWTAIALGDIGPRPLDPKYERRLIEELKKLEQDRSKDTKSKTEKKDEPEGVPLVFTEDTKADVSTVIIPKRFLRTAEKRATAGGPATDPSVADSGLRTRTAIAGIALSLAVASVLLLRRTNRTVKVLSILALSGIAAWAAWPLPRTADAAEKRAEATADGPRVVIVLVDRGEKVEIVHGTKAER